MQRRKALHIIVLHAVYNITRKPFARWLAGDHAHSRRHALVINRSSYFSQITRTQHELLYCADVLYVERCFPHSMCVSLSLQCSFRSAGPGLNISGENLPTLIGIIAWIYKQAAGRVFHKKNLENIPDMFSRFFNVSGRHVLPLACKFKLWCQSMSVNSPLKCWADNWGV